MKANDFKNKAIDDMLKYAFQEANAELIDEMPQCEEVEFSKEHEDKMRKLFAGKVRRMKYIKRIFMIAAVMVILFSISVMSVQGWRASFMNFILSFTESNTELKYRDEAEDKNSYTVGDVTFEYLPSGFTLDSNKNQGKVIYVKFNKGNEYFETKIKESNPVANVDTEKAGAELLMINGAEVFVTQKDDNISVSWNNNLKTFELMGNIEREELLKIAENIKT